MGPHCSLGFWTSLRSKLNLDRWHHSSFYILAKSQRACLPSIALALPLPLTCPRYLFSLRGDNIREPLVSPRKDLSFLASLMPSSQILVLIALCRWASPLFREPPASSRPSACAPSLAPRCLSEALEPLPGRQLRLQQDRRVATAAGKGREGLPLLRIEAVGSEPHLP